MTVWKPKEIIVHQSVKDDPHTRYFLTQCPDTPVRFTGSGRATEIVKQSERLKTAGPSMLDKILAGKQVVFIAPAGTAVDLFEMPDQRMVCPHFDRLKLASNGCFYQCDWCYLKLTYRAAFPFITVRVQYDRIKQQVIGRLSRTSAPVIFNSGELADSLALEHLTQAGRYFIPWFGKSRNGYLYMLTKSDQVDPWLDLPHQGRTILTWSLNNDHVSRKFEIGAPTFTRRLAAARKAQDAGYPLRLRLDPIVPVENWQDLYADTIRRIFETVSPERITLGTLRFEDGFYKMRHTFFTTGPDLPSLMEDMQPMFPAQTVPGHKKPKTGKYSFNESRRTAIFQFAVREIRKYSDCRIALCKESATVWQNTGLPLSRVACVCQLDAVDMDAKNQGAG